MRHTALCLQCVGHARQESEWNTHTNTFLSNNSSLIAVHFRNLVQLCSHQTMLFKRNQVRFVGAGTVGRQRSHHPNKPNSDVNRTQVRTKSAKTQITENMCLICLQAFKFIMHPKHKSLTCTFACVCVCSYTSWAWLCSENGWILCH